MRHFFLYYVFLRENTKLAQDCIFTFLEKVIFCKNECLYQIDT